MSDDEDYNSEEDFDYVPSDGEQVSEEENSGDEEDLSLLNDGDSNVKLEARKGKPVGKKKANVVAARQRKGGIKLEDEGGGTAVDKVTSAEDDEAEQKRKKELMEEIAKDEEERKKEKEKKRSDDLWSSFMSGVKVPVRPSPSAKTGSGLGNLTSQQVKPTDVKRPVQNKVTITKVFDFAGEEVKVTKEVDADSKEAKEEQTRLEQGEVTTAQSTPTTTTTNNTVPSLQSSLKRPSAGGLGSVLNKIGKKSKMGTLEKSKLDWDSFKTKEGIQDDVKIHNKGKQGYTERMAFLNRADQRQFEIERDLRLGSTSKR